VGEALGVRTVLEGSVRKAGQRLRITAQLVDVFDQSHIWSERFDRQVVDVFDIQDEIAQAIAAKLHVKLVGAQPIVARQTHDLQAYEALLEARHFFSQFTPEGTARAADSLTRALTLAPDYPDALSLQALYHVMRAYMFEDPRVELERAREMAARALNADGNHGDARAAMALVIAWMDRDWPAAERGFLQALAVAPASARVHELHGLITLLGTGRIADALAELDRAIQLDPLSPLYAGNRGRVLTCARRFADAEESCRRGLALDPGQLLVQVELIYALTFQYKFVEAHALGRKSVDATAHANAIVHALAVSFAVAGKQDEALQLVSGPSAGDRYGSPLTAGLVYAASGDMDAAFEQVSRALDELDPLLMYLTVHPMFDVLRSDPRYAQLVRRMNLE
jgi:Tfp pilus assembly protein PilF